MVTMTHPDLPEQPISVDVAAVDGWKDRGWQIKATAKKTTAKKAGE